MRHKKGDTFDLSGPLTVRDVDDNVIPDLTGWTGEAEIRQKDGTLLASLTFEWLDASQSLCRLTYPDTSGWERGQYFTDIRVTSPESYSVSTDIETIDVYTGVTLPA